VAQPGTMKLVVLWEDEIRTAAKAIAHAHNLAHSGTAAEGEVGEALRDALNACNAALHGADDESAALVLSAKPAVQPRSETDKAGEEQ